MTAVKEKIQALDDFQVVRFFEHFGRQLANGSNVSFEQIKNGIPNDVRMIEGFDQIEGLTPEQADYSLNASTSANMARNILVYLADDPEFGPVIETSLNTYYDDELVANAILAVGFVASILLMVATTEFEGEVAGIKIKKHKADAEILKAITEPFATVLSNIVKPQ